MAKQQHPGSEQLDQLRAGLLDDQADVKASLENHLEQCPSCQSRFNNWQQLGPAALGPQLDTESLGRSLQQARQRAMHSQDSQPSHAFMPYATAALLLVAVSAGYWATQPDSQDTNMASVDHQNIPGLYEDLDFYLWLAEQNGNSIDSEKINPNNT